MTRHHLDFGTLLRSAFAAVGVSVLAATAGAQASTATLPVREVTEPIARAIRPIGGANSIRALPDGSVFVNDVQRRQLLLFDANLKDVVVVADTAPGALMPYGQRPMGLIPYLGDSTLVADPSTYSMVLLNAQGKTERVIASPRTNDINLLSNVNLGSYAFDPQGRLYYRLGTTGGGPAGGFGGGFPGGGGRGGGLGGGGGRATTPTAAANQQLQQARAASDAGQSLPPSTAAAGGAGPFGGPGSRGFNPASQPDSVPVIRVDFDTRKSDTVTFLRVPKNEVSMTRGDDGSMRLSVKINPLPQSDDWALLNDGTVAVIRVLDYHVDYYSPDGRHVASQRLPFDWKQITDDDKTKLVDSLAGLAKAATERSAAGGGGNFRMNFEPVAAEKLPDYYPPIRAGTSLADRDGNLWTLPATSNLSAQLAQQFMGGGGRGGAPGAAGAGRPGAAGAPRDSARTGGIPPAAMAMMAGMMNQPPLVYDIINRQGELVERVKLPPNRQLLGFGPNGTIFLGAREGRTIILEKVTRK